MKSFYSALAITASILPLAHGFTTFDFDGATPATTTGTPLSTSVTLENAYYETQDANGDPLANPGFRPLDVGSTVVVGDPSLSGYGPPISGNALNGLDSPIMFTFASAMNLSNFGIMLDNSTYGTIRTVGGNPAFTTNVLFYDAADSLVGFIPLDETVAGFTVANDPGNYLNVSKVILPSGAFFDNVTFAAQAVPEPTVAGLACLGALALLKRRRA